MKFLVTSIKLFRELDEYELADQGGKFKVFFVLIRLLFKSKFHSGSSVNTNIAGFAIQAYDYPKLINLYKEIFLAKVYDFETDNPAPLIIDCGAHIGMTVLFMKRRYPKSQILAFEPNPNAFHLLKANIDNNGIKGVTLFNLALSSSAGEASFYVPKEKGSLNGSLTLNNFPSETIQIKVCRLSDVIGKEIVDLLKIDVEGGEEMILRDLNSKESFDQLKNIVVEYHQFEGNVSPSAFVSSIERNGFESTIRSIDDVRAVHRNIIFSFSRKAITVHPQ